MHLNRSDRDKIIIVGVLLAIIALVCFVFHFTRFIPLKYIAVLFFVFMFVESAVISKKYFELYDVEAGVSAYIPVWNSISTFPKVLSVLLIINSIIWALLGVCLVVPPTVITKLGLDAALSVNTTIGAFFVFTFIIEFLIYGAGYCSILRDVNGMLYEVTGVHTSKMELVYYILLLIPLFNVLGMTLIITNLNKLAGMNYHAGDTVSDEVDLFEEDEH